MARLSLCLDCKPSCSSAALSFIASPPATPSPVASTIHPPLPVSGLLACMHACSMSLQIKGVTTVLTSFPSGREVKRSLVSVFHLLSAPATRRRRLWLAGREPCRLAASLLICPAQPEEPAKQQEVKLHRLLSATALLPRAYGALFRGANNRE